MKRSDRLLRHTSPSLPAISNSLQLLLDSNHICRRESDKLMAATWLAVMVATAAAYAPLAQPRRGTRLQMSDDSWAQELAQAGGGFERQEASRWQKSDRGKADAESRKRNDAILKWLESNDVWVSELSGWNEPPHSLALATSTFDELEGEDSGRGLLARRAIAQDAILARLPVRLCMTKEAALEARELKGIVSEATNEYVAIACC